MRNLVATVLLLGAADRSWSQGAAVPLKPPTGTLPVEFIAITSARELSDGRVLLNDPRENRVVVADFAKGTATQIGRVGQGPGEYPIAFPLLALTGDSSLMANGLAKRWLLFAGTSIVATLPADAPVVRNVILAYGADNRGNVLATKHGPISPRGEVLTDHDTTFIVLVARSTGKQDTVGRMWLGPKPSPQIKSNQFRPFAVWEQAMLANDGWIAVLRAEPYRVDWRSPAGQWTLGAPIVTPRIPLTDREKQSFIARRRRAGSSMTADMVGEWPSTIPPWAGDALTMTSDGKVLVRRTETADHPDPWFDVINRQGKVERQIKLVAGEYIVGFGKGTVYVTFKDADDIVRLRRYPWP